jgi:hypothetical protein
VRLSPRISITDVGVDTNVFQTEENPQQDFTAKVSPGADYWLPIRRVQLGGSTTVGFLYFRELAENRAIELIQTGRMDVILNRLRPRLTGSYAELTQRPNLEIDVRVPQTTGIFGVGTDVRLGSRVTLTLDGRRQRLEYEDTEFEGVNIATALNRRTDTLAASMRVALTPLTTFVLAGDSMRDTFLNDPLRDAESVGIVPGFELKPAALIAGTAFVGVRHIDLKDPGLPDYTGLVANVGVSFTVKGRTLLTVGARRFLDYSFEEDEPYFINGGVTLAVTEALGRGWDVRATYGRDNLNYQRELSPIPDPSEPRVDRVKTAGAGVGRRLGQDARVGLDVTHVQRQSTAPDRSYDGWRYTGAFTYGL